MSVDLTAAQLLEFLKEECRLADEEAKLAARIPDEIRAEKGDLVQGLTIITASKERVYQLLLPESAFCRFRVGDRLLLRSGQVRVVGNLTALEGQDLFIECKENLDCTVEWSAELKEAGFPPSILRALNDLAGPGIKPGDYFLDVLAGRKEVKYRGGSPLEVEKVLQDMGPPMEGEQAEAVREAARLPTLWALQGPPGTGKTRVAVALIEVMARAGLRVLVMAHTHAAVWNLLAEHEKEAIRQQWPCRRHLKLGSSLHMQQGETKIETLSWLPRFPEPKKREPMYVYGATVMRALSLTETSTQKFDAVIVDEAGQVALTNGACLGKLSRCVLLLGDPAQLAPIFPEGLRTHPLAISILQKWQECLIAKGRQLQALKTTYRMNAPLALAVSNAWYRELGGTGLVSAETSASNLLEWTPQNTFPWIQESLDPEIPLVWVQTGELGCTTSSVVEAEAISQLVASARAGMQPNHRICVLAPFRAQVAEVGRRCGKNCQVDTVERLQGQSVDMAILSLTSSDPDYLAQIAAFYFLDNRWNVAFSRAKTKVIVVGSSEVLAAVPGSVLGALAREHLRKVLECAHVVKLPELNTIYDPVKLVDMPIETGS